ncbi:MAG TPA: hypothetical protein VKP10_01470 [Gemmatimonadales bacterium]|nr:hypothetical protein [Gemmatimonadales bacterium]
MITPGRPLATFAVGFLLLDAVLLAWAGLEQHRPGLLAGAIACALAAAAVVILWRRYRRTLADLDAGRAEMKAEAEEIRRLLREKHLQN